MEAAAPPVTTGSKTMADLFGRPRRCMANHAFARHKAGDEWQDISYAQAWEIIREIGLGLIDIGVQGGDRVCIPGQHAAPSGRSPTSARRAPVPSWCRSINQLAEGVRVGGEQLRGRRRDRRRRSPGGERSSRSATTCPNLRHIVVMEPEGADASAIALDGLRERGRGRDAASCRRASTRSRPRTRSRSSTHRHDRAAEGLRADARNYRSMLDMCTSLSVLRGGAEADVIYLFLPLAHSSPC